MKPSREPAAYAGTYEDAAYGTVRITADDGVLTLEWGRFRKPLKHFHYDAHLIDEPDVRGAGPLARIMHTLGQEPLVE